MDDSEEWFSLEFELGEANTRPDDVWSLREVARLTGRSLSAVKAARNQGRIPAAPRPGGLRGQEAQEGFVRASREELERWRLKTVEEVLADRPDLPGDPGRWLTINELAEALDLTRSGVNQRIQALDPRRLEWGRAGPFRTEVRYWLPDLISGGSAEN